ncbi:MAG: SDR family oxidoreductase [Flavobacteriaceae bacterium]|nr:SDR family oxidoreductase [Bacteroidia bacterium]NNF74593.1 SDR family oxidoreductase [Flavobacteriaceae bacterium]NNK87321.1 SDR family oxidoreductase [Flavobacteriaceae bacterium]
MDFGLNGKSALVAASSQGLGRAVAEALVNEGVNVAICGRNKDALEKAKSELKALGSVKVIAVQADLSIKEDCEDMVDKIIQEFGQIDILVTNSGGPPAGTFESFDDQDWKNAFNLLIGSATRLIRQVLPVMKAQNWGRIIMISSQAVKQPVDNLILSNAVRSSILGLMKSLANELGPNNITVNNVMPGYTKTNRLMNLIEGNPGLKDAIDEIPLGRFGEPEEFAAAVAFLASERASYITGISLAVDGGWIKGT